MVKIYKKIAFRPVRRRMSVFMVYGGKRRRFTMAIIESTRNAYPHIKRVIYVVFYDAKRFAEKTDRFYLPVRAIQYNNMRCNIIIHSHTQRRLGVRKSLRIFECARVSFRTEQTARIVVRVFLESHCFQTVLTNN